jgi:hypothetical protein
MDVVALNVVRRTAAYSCRLRLSDGGGLTVRSVVSTAGVTGRRPGVPAPAVRQEALASPVAGPASRGGRDERRSSRPGLARWPALRTGGSLCGRVTGGCRRRVLAPRAGGR